MRRIQMYILYALQRRISFRGQVDSARWLQLSSITLPAIYVSDQLHPD